jgi:hypothetical protein
MGVVNITTVYVYVYVRAFGARQTSTRSNLEQLAEIFAFGFGVSCNTFAVPPTGALELSMHKDA